MLRGAQRAPHPLEFEQPCLSRVKWHRSNTPKFVPSHRGTDQPYTNKHTLSLPGDDSPLALKIGVGLELAEVLLVVGSS